MLKINAENMRKIAEENRIKDYPDFVEKQIEYMDKCISDSANEGCFETKCSIYLIFSEKTFILPEYYYKKSVINFDSYISEIVNHYVSEKFDVSFDEVNQIFTIKW